MRVVIQRVSEASVRVNEKIVGEIGEGLTVLVGFEQEDENKDLEWMANKLLGIRLFSDEEGKMNLSVLDIKGELLVVSQFTLYASTKKGTRPSFVNAAKPEYAEKLYETFKSMLNDGLGRKVASGIFGADMKVSLVNCGPVTINIDSKNRA